MTVSPTPSIRRPQVCVLGSAEPGSPATLVFAKEHERRIRFHCWLQFEADRQLALGL